MALTRPGTDRIVPPAAPGSSGGADGRGGTVPAAIHRARDADERIARTRIIVTTFTAGSGIQTLPIWIFANYQRPNNLPLVNVAAVFVLILSIVPVYLASRLTEDTSGISGRR